jgi:hypothetical protein
MLVLYAVSEKIIKGGDAVLPGNFFSFLVSSPIIGDRNLVNPEPPLGNLDCNFGLKTEAVGFDLDAFKNLRPEGLVPYFHVREVEVC